MTSADIPALSENDLRDCVRQAAASQRRRHPKILHKPGDVFNRVFNFIMHDSYMQPHLHPGEEKIEHIYLVRGEAAVLLFDAAGKVEKVVHLKEGAETFIAVPAFTWHTYVMLSDHTVTYETMMGQYEPKSWKEFASWAPREGTPEAPGCLEELKAKAKHAIVKRAS